MPTSKISDGGGLPIRFLDVECWVGTVPAMSIFLILHLDTFAAALVDCRLLKRCRRFQVPGFG